MSDDEHKRQLLSLARAALVAAAEHVALPAAPLGSEPTHGVFVTLYDGDGLLRGCIGNFQQEEGSVAEAVIEMTKAAALSDPRFSPVTPAEVASLRIELSLLSETRPARSEDILIGQHGVVLRRGFLRGVFLPKVALEQGWTREELLCQLSRKANLPAEAWAWKDTTLETFTAEVFGEVR